MLGICGFLSHPKNNSTGDIAKNMSLPFAEPEAHLKWCSDDKGIVMAHSLNRFSTEMRTLVSDNSDGIYAVIFGKAFLHDEYSENYESFLTNEDLGRLYAQMGVDCFSHIDGYWAIAIADCSQRKIIIARDRRAFKAIYYSVNNNSFFFSSSIKSFENSFSLSVDPDSVKMFLHYLYIPSPKTIYKEVHAVEAGECITFSQERGLSKKNYTEEILGYPWRRDSEGPDRSLTEYLNQFQDLIVQSASQHVRNSKKTAILFSGGKDSSAIATAAKLAGHENVEALTVGFDDSSIDEGMPAEAIARHLGLKQRVVRFTEEDYIQSMFPVINSLEQPMGDSAAFPVYLAISKTCDEFDTYLEGSGCDSYFIIPANGMEKITWYIHKYLPSIAKMFRGNWNCALPYRVDFIIKRLRKDRRDQFTVWNGWTENELNSLTGCRLDKENLLLTRFYNQVKCPDFFKTLTFSILAAEAYVQKVEKISSHFDVNMGYPFVSFALTRFCQGLHQKLLYDKHDNKILMRLFLEKYLPDNLANRPKGYFTFKKNTLLRANGYSFLDEFVSQQALIRHNVVDARIARDYVHRYKSGDFSVEDRVWGLLLLHCWLETRGRRRT